MRSLPLLVVGTVLLAFFFQCCPSAALPKPTTPCEVESPSPSPDPVESPRPSPAPPSPTTLAPERVQAQVVRAMDGDTIDVEIEGEVYCVRYLGVDCPEAGCEFGQLATDVNRALVEGKRVELEKDMPDTDEHGRLLRYVFVGGMMVNAKLLRPGYASAVTVPPDVAHGEEFLGVEQEARLSGVGLWRLEASPTPLPPTPTPAETAPANVVVDLGCCQLDAPGDDGYNKEEEWVCFANNGGQIADMTGWYLRDGYGYTFPAFSLAPGASMRVRTGCGTNTVTDVYWCKDGTVVWNNDGDIVFLFAAGGNLVTQHSY